MEGGQAWRVAAAQRALVPRLTLPSRVVADQNWEVEETFKEASDTKNNLKL